MDLGLKGRVAMVAAASRGLGRAVAEELAKVGCDVAICARTAGELERTAAEIGKASGRSVFWRAMDVTKEEAVRRFVSDVERKFGRVDICVTNAGGPPSKKFLDITIEEWRAAVDLTLMSAVYFAREALPRMQRNRWGRFLTITSVSVKQPMTGLAKTLANEFGSSGITVNNVCPGYTRTERLDELAGKQAQMTGKQPEEIFQAWSSEVPIGRIARPEEFAALVAFLASERASSMNGTTIPVDGGWVKGLL